MRKIGMFVATLGLIAAVGCGEPAKPPATTGTGTGTGTAAAPASTGTAAAPADKPK